MPVRAGQVAAPDPDHGYRVDRFYVVREQWARYLEPVHGPSDVAVEMWIARLGQSNATYAFRVRSRDAAGAR